MSLTIWCNGEFDPEATRRLREGTAGHRLIAAAGGAVSVLAPPVDDPALAEAEVAFGQPPAASCLRHAGLRWVHVSTAGYTRYDTPEFRDAFRARGSRLTTSSGVFADPVAQHLLAMILAVGRELLPSYREQLGGRRWPQSERRYASTRLTGQTVLMLGFGAIGRRFAQLIAPFECRLYALRRQTRSVLGVRIVAEEDLTRILPLADHVVNLLPENEATRNWMNARRFACLRPGTRFYNVGRGTTVDQPALQEALESGRLGAAYLDVTDPEPLPPGHALWTAPNCYLTPHTAGGRRDQDRAIVEHFLGNLAAFERGGELADQVI
jgi:phosphoglycerate dehydrogenase-like enzyme